MLALAGGYLWTVAWAIGDAEKRGQSGGAVVFLFWLFGPLAALVWLSTRPSETLTKRGPDSYTDPEDAIAAASRLDSLGDWDAAVQFYESIAKRWPEHSEYVGNCLSELQRKMHAINSTTRNVG